jgi:hypothetical protein
MLTLLVEAVMCKGGENEIVCSMKSLMAVGIYHRILAEIGVHGLVLTGVREQIVLWGGSRGVSIEAGARHNLKRS